MAEPDTPVAGGATAAEVIAFHARRRTPRGARFRLRVPYGATHRDGRPLTLSLYARTDPAARRPAVVFAHGGGWSGGDPYFHIRHANELAAHGFVSATIGYRLYPDARWPEPLDDLKAAIRWIRANADRIGADPDRIAVAGGSAGAHLAAWVALSPDAGEAVQAACLWYPVVDVNAMLFPSGMRADRDMIERFFGTPGPAGERERRAASPLYAVRRGAPPILTMTGSDDEVTPRVPIEDFHRRLREAGIRNELVVLDGRAHAFDMWSPEDWQRCTDRAVAFLTDVLR